jgi:hypothetical protein
MVKRLQARVDRLRRDVVPGVRIAQYIDIERLICPLRYDIWMRVEFIRLLRDEWMLYQHDPDEFLSRPQARAYYIWFREVACARFHPEIYPHEKLVQGRFRTRVDETARLWQSIERDGFDPIKPVRLHSGRAILDVNGKRVEASFFPGNGCHRIAALYLTGQRQLEPAQYEVEVHRRYQPLDNTAILLRALPLDRTSYLQFLSRFYCDGEIRDADGILRHVAVEKPSLLPELKSVLAGDHAPI